jgi:hypothetical protein
VTIDEQGALRAVLFPHVTGPAPDNMLPRPKDLVEQAQMRAWRATAWWPAVMV